MIAFGIVILLSLFFILLLVTIYGYLVFRKLINILINKKKRIWLEQHLQDIKNYLIKRDGNITFKPNRVYQLGALEDFFSEYLSNYIIESNDDPILKFANQYFVPKYKKRLFHRRWSIRMNTLYFIDLFQLKKMQEDLLKLLTCRKCSSDEAFQIYNLLATFEYDNFLTLLKEAKELPTFLLHEILGRLIDTNNFEKYTDMFYEFPLWWQKSILDVIRDKNFRSEKLQALLETLLQDSLVDEELRIRAMKTLASLGYVSSHELIITYLEQNKQRFSQKNQQTVIEKMMAARLMGSIKRDLFLPYLEKFISDSSYMVRAEAAKSMRKYKNGKEHLEAIATSHLDPYARDIALEWLEKGIEYE